MTETTQPDPQVVAWMRGYLRDNPAPTTYGSGNKATALRTYIQAHSPGGTVRGTGFCLRELADAYDAALRPLTVADIPAGQGPASLFLAPDPVGGGEPVLWFKAHDDRLAPVSTDGPRYRTEVRALWEHLAATLPTVTTEETP